MTRLACNRTDKHIKWDPYNGISLLHFLLLGSLFYMLVEAAQRLPVPHNVMKENKGNPCRTQHNKLQHVRPRFPFSFHQQLCGTGADMCSSNDNVSFSFLTFDELMSGHVGPKDSFTWNERFSLDRTVVNRSFQWSVFSSPTCEPLTVPSTTSWQEFKRKGPATTTDVNIAGPISFSFLSTMLWKGRAYRAQSGSHVSWRLQQIQPQETHSRL